MTKPKQTSHLQISMKVEIELTLGFLFQVCEIHELVPIKYNSELHLEKSWYC